MTQVTEYLNDLQVYIANIKNAGLSGQIIDYHAVAFLLFAVVSFVVLVFKVKSKVKVFLLSLVLGVVLSVACHNKIVDEITLEKMAKNHRWREDLPMLRVRYRKLVSLCEKYSVNEIYDENKLNEYDNMPSSSNEEGFEKSEILKTNKLDKEKIINILAQVNEKYNEDKNATYLFWKKAGFLYYSFSFEKVDECINKNCKITEYNLYNLNNKSIIAHYKNIVGFEPQKKIYSVPNSCKDLKVGAFIESNKNSWRR